MRPPARPGECDRRCGGRRRPHFRGGALLRESRRPGPGAVSMADIPDTVQVLHPPPIIVRIALFEYRFVTNSVLNPPTGPCPYGVFGQAAPVLPEIAMRGNSRRGGLPASISSRDCFTPGWYGGWAPFFLAMRLFFRHGAPGKERPSTSSFGRRRRGKNWPDRIPFGGSRRANIPQAVCYEVPLSKSPTRLVDSDGGQSPRRGNFSRYNPL